MAINEQQALLRFKKHQKKKLENKQLLRPKVSLIQQYSLIKDHQHWLFHELIEIAKIKKPWKIMSQLVNPEIMNLVRKGLSPYFLQVGDYLWLGDSFLLRIKEKHKETATVLLSRIPKKEMHELSSFIDKLEDTRYGILFTYISYLKLLKLERASKKDAKYFEANEEKVFKGSSLREPYQSLEDYAHYPFGMEFIRELSNV